MQDLATPVRNRPLVLAHVLHHLHIGGMENGVVNLINRLPHADYRHVVVCVEDYSDFAKRIERVDVELIAMHRSRIGVWSMRRAMYKLFKQLRPDIVHTRNLSGLDALLPARLCGARTVHSEHGFDVDNLDGLAGRPVLLRRLHAPLVDRFVCVSKDLRRLMAEHWRLPRNRISQIYNGVDTQRFRPRRPDEDVRELLPARWREPGTFIVGTVGRAQRVKDQATLLRAAAQVIGQVDADTRKRFGVVVVGDGPELSALSSLASDLRMRDHCWFAGARTDIPQLMRTLDLFVLPSLAEGISNTVLEAMATGLPMLVTGVGGNTELVPESGCGARFKPGDVGRLAELVADYLAHPATTSAHGAMARQRATEDFSLEAMVAGYQRVYETVSAF